MTIDDKIAKLFMRVDDRELAVEIINHAVTLSNRNVYSIEHALSFINTADSIPRKGCSYDEFEEWFHKARRESIARALMYQKYQ